MSPVELGLLVAEVVKRAPALRDAGVLELAIGEVSMKFAPAVVYQPDVTIDEPDPEPVDALSDPATYGLPPGSRLPGDLSPARPTPPDEDADR